jgi:hypothetical protein
VSCSVREPIVDFDGASVSPMSDERIAFSATEVDRGDWGRTWNMALETGGVVVGKKVGIELNVQAVAGPGLSDAV